MNEIVRRKLYDEISSDEFEIRSKEIYIRDVIANPDSLKDEYAIDMDKKILEIYRSISDDDKKIVDIEDVIDSVIDINIDAIHELATLETLTNNYNQINTVNNLFIDTGDEDQANSMFNEYVDDMIMEYENDFQTSIYCDLAHFIVYILIQNNKTFIYKKIGNFDMICSDFLSNLNFNTAIESPGIMFNDAQTLLFPEIQLKKNEKLWDETGFDESIIKKMYLCEAKDDYKKESNLKKLENK